MEHDAVGIERDERPVLDEDPVRPFVLPNGLVNVRVDARIRPAAPADVVDDGPVFPGHVGLDMAG